MSWLRRLRSQFNSSPHWFADRRVYLDESPRCVANFESMDLDAIVLHLEAMVDERDRSEKIGTRTKCDLIAIQGTESRLDIVLVEVKAGDSLEERTVVARLRKALSQLTASVDIVRNEIQYCRVGLPERQIGRAVIVVNTSGQETILRNNLSPTVANFRRETGFRLFMARCGDDIGRLI